MDALISIAEHLGIRNFPCSEELAEHVILLGDTISPIVDDNVKFTRILLLHDGVRITSVDDIIGGIPSHLQLPGLSMIGASLAFQEILRQHNCIRRVDVVKNHVTVQYRIDPRDLPGRILPTGDFQIRGPDGTLSPLYMKEWKDGSGHISLIGRLESNCEEILQLIKSTELLDLEENSQIFNSSIIEVRIPRQTGSVSGSAILAGAGGLGTWALHAFSRGLENAGHSGVGVEITIIDPDPEVEIHNLNRQILYCKDDIGSTKASAASAAIARRLPYADIVSGVQRLGIPELEIAQGHFCKIKEELDAEMIDIGIGESTLEPSIINDILNRSKVLVSGVDNLRSRAILSAISSVLDIPFINAGASGWSGQMDVIRPDESCMICRYGKGIAKDDRTASCQEDGDIPFSSIVTSTAIFGALEGLALLASLSDNATILESWPGQIVWGGRENNISVFEGESKGPFFTNSSTHETHIIDALSVV